MATTWVVSDVHGHLDDLRALLRDGGLLNVDDAWTGGDDQLWVLGDMVDRGPDGIGVVRLLRDLVRRQPDRVHVLLGNHEALMVGEKLFRGSQFDDVWVINGGKPQDQDALTDDEVAWLRALPAMALVEGNLLVHSDTTDYLQWGESVEEVNQTLAGLLGGDDEQRHFDVFAALTSRYDFNGADGAEVARSFLDTYGGHRLVHGHSIIGTFTGQPSAEVDGPLAYAEDLVLAVDGGRYDGGPLLLVPLDRFG